MATRVALDSVAMRLVEHPHNELMKERWKEEEEELRAAYPYVNE